MDKASTRKKLSPSKKLEVWNEYKRGGCSVRSLAAKYGCSKSTVSNIIKGERPEIPTALPDPPEVKESLKRAKINESKELGVNNDKNLDLDEPGINKRNNFLSDPLEFREKKLEEIAIDLQTSRISGRTSIIPQLHRLHLSIHDEVTQMRESGEGVEDGLDQAALVATIVGTISKLPPMIRQNIQDQIEDLETGRIISFPQTQIEDEEIG